MKELYKRILILAAPIALQNMISYGVGLADNLMVGSLGELALSGVYSANQLQNLLHMVVIGLGAAMVILASQYWGKHDHDNTRAVVGIALKGSLAAGLICLGATLFFPEQILRLFTNDPEVIRTAHGYLKIIRFTYPIFAITQVLLAAMRIVEKVKVGFYLSLMSFVINVSLNWILIFGKLGFPALGVAGAALATLITRGIELPVLLYYVAKKDDRLRLKLADVLHSNMALIKDFFRYGTPVLLGDILWGVNLAVQGAILGRLGATTLAAASIANVVFSMVSVGVYGVAGASALIIGQTVGAEDYHRAKQYAKWLQVLFVFMGLGTGLFLFGIKDIILSFYNLGPEALHITRLLLTILSITIVGTAYQMSALTGIVRAGGSIYFVLINDLIFVWLVVIPSALIAWKVFNAHPAVVFACLKSDQILKCLVAVVKVNRFDWMKDLTRPISN